MVKPKLGNLLHLRLILSATLLMQMSDFKLLSMTHMLISTFHFQFSIVSSNIPSQLKLVDRALFNSIGIPIAVTLFLHKNLSDRVTTKIDLVLLLSLRMNYQIRYVCSDFGFYKRCPNCNFTVFVRPIPDCCILT